MQAVGASMNCLHPSISHYCNAGLRPAFECDPA